MPTTPMPSPTDDDNSSSDHVIDDRFVIDRANHPDQPDPTALAVHHELFFGGPRSSDALIAVLTQQGLSVTGDELEELLDAGEIPHVVELGYLGDEPLYVALDSLLEERVFTHRITAAEIAASVLTIEPDLKPLMVLTDAPPFDRLEDGSPIAEVFSGESVDPGGALLVQAGTLSAFQPGDLVGVGVGAGGLRIEQVDQLAVPAADLAARVAAKFSGAEGDGAGGDSAEGDNAEDDTDEGGLPVMLDELIWGICGEDLMAFVDPLPPLTELLDSWGLERFGDVVAPAGFDFSTWGVGNRLTELARAYDLTHEQALAVIAVRSVFSEVLQLVNRRLTSSDEPANGDEPADDSTEEPLLELSAVPLELADAAVAEAVFWETVGEGVQEAIALGALVESWEPQANRRVRPALAWLRGKSLERLGNILQAEAAFDESLSLEPSFVTSLIDMARFAADRGDAARAISLLERVGFSDQDQIVAQLRDYLPVERLDVGRNDPCWCGSGRKYKRCHLGRAELSASKQASWLYEKAVAFAHDAPYGELLLGLAAVRSEALGTDRLGATSDRAVLDVTLFEGGVLADFLATRGVLLPAAEQLVAAAWLLVERSVFEVTEVRRGKDVTLKDLRTGDSQLVPDVAMSRSVKIGELVCTRLLPVGDTVEIHSSVEPVPLHLLDETLRVLDTEGDATVDPYELITILSARFAPPQMITGEGDPLVLCTAEFEITGGELDRVIEVLCERFEAVENQPTAPEEPGEETGPVSYWQFTTPASHGTRIVASFMLTGHRLQVDSSSERRFEESLAVVRAADPGAAVLSETRTHPADTVAQQQLSPEPSATSSPFADPTDPAVAAVLAEATADYERRWLDMELPALAGLTPRQAAGDPTRREDLLRLLRSFEGFTSGPGTMDVARLRDALKL